MIYESGTLTTAAPSGYSKRQIALPGRIMVTLRAGGPVEIRKSRKFADASDAAYDVLGTFSTIGTYYVEMGGVRDSLWEVYAHFTGSAGTASVIMEQSVEDGRA